MVRTQIGTDSLRFFYLALSAFICVYLRPTLIYIICGLLSDLNFKNHLTNQPFNDLTKAALPL
jgi:hypothetical protein